MMGAVELCSTLAVMMQLVHPDNLPPASLDSLLAEGWFRVQQSMMTSRISDFDGVFRSTIWTRIALTDFRFRKSHRKLIRRNKRRFRVEMGPLHIDERRRELYHAYLTSKPKRRSETLEDVLFGERDADLFDGREIAVYDGPKLVAFSWFDRGERSLQSNLGVYDPAYARYSLGLFTMLLEISYGMEHGYLHHYAGYVLPGEPSMDYKVCVGGVEFLDDVNQAWRPWSEKSRYQPALARLERGLRLAQRILGQKGLVGERVENSLYYVGNVSESLRRALPYPIFLDCTSDPFTSVRRVLAYDVDVDRFSVHTCRRFAVELRSPDHACTPPKVGPVSGKVGPSVSVPYLVYLSTESTRALTCMTGCEKIAGPPPRQENR